MAITCPKGHTGPFEIMEDATLTYDIEEIDDEEKVIFGNPSADQLDGDNTRLCCMAQFEVTVEISPTPILTYCGAELPIPDDYSLEYT